MSSGLEDERTFSSLLTDSVCESISAALGNIALSILVSEGSLDEMGNPSELDRQLSSKFGNGATMLERIIVKGLYRKLRIPFDPTVAFDYAMSLDTARNAFFVKNRRE
jgi:hypothetical protein